MLLSSVARRLLEQSSLRDVDLWLQRFGFVVSFLCNGSFFGGRGFQALHDFEVEPQFVDLLLALVGLEGWRLLGFERGGGDLLFKLGGGHGWCCGVGNG
jgi:hypothetical protein